jgi:hypothetical protein
VRERGYLCTTTSPHPMLDCWNAHLRLGCRRCQSLLVDVALSLGQHILDSGFDLRRGTDVPVLDALPQPCMKIIHVQRWLYVNGTTFRSLTDQDAITYVSLSVLVMQ